MLDSTAKWLAKQCREAIDSQAGGELDTFVVELTDRVRTAFISKTYKNVCNSCNLMHLSAVDVRTSQCLS